MRAAIVRRMSSGGKKAAELSTGYTDLFEQFKSADECSIGPDGVEQLCTAMRVEPSDVLVLVLAWVLRTSQMGYISREEWTSGAARLGAISSAGALRQELEAIHKQALADIERLRDLHLFTHKFCREGTRKNIDVQSAKIMLSIVLEPLFGEHVQSLTTFMDTKTSLAKTGVSLDEWMMILQFCREIKPDCSNFQDDGAWPLLLDDYVEWRREEPS